MNEPKRYKVELMEKGNSLAKQAKMALSFSDRLIGLMFREKMVDFDGLLLEPCNSIHTFFMRYPIDVLFLDKSNKVVKINKGLKPWRATTICFKAKKVLELNENTLPLDIEVGDSVRFECIN